MENASKALIIAGAILLSILIIAIGMYIYSSAQAQVDSSLTTMSTSEIEGFNSTFTSYQGEQTGSNVKALINRLVANANTYSEEPAKIPAFSYNAGQQEDASKNNRDDIDNLAWGVRVEGETAGYLRYLSNVSRGLDLKHKYFVVMTMGSSGVVSGITVNYDGRTGEFIEPNPENFQAVRNATAGTGLVAQGIDPNGPDTIQADGETTNGG